MISYIGSLFTEIAVLQWLLSRCCLVLFCSKSPMLRCLLYPVLIAWYSSVQICCCLGSLLHYVAVSLGTPLFEVAIFSVVFCTELLLLGNTLYLVVVAYIIFCSKLLLLRLPSVHNAKSLTLSRRQVIIITSTFEKLPRAWFCSDRRQISAENRTAHAVHCQKEIFEFYSKMNNL
jgi:hypothetical protein